MALNAHAYIRIKQQACLRHAAQKDNSREPHDFLPSTSHLSNSSSFIPFPFEKSLFCHLPYICISLLLRLSDEKGMQLNICNKMLGTVIDSAAMGISIHSLFSLFQKLLDHELFKLKIQQGHSRNCH